MGEDASFKIFVKCIFSTLVYISQEKPALRGTNDCGSGLSNMPTARES